MDRDKIFDGVVDSLIDTYRKAYGRDPDESEIEKIRNWTNSITGRKSKRMIGLDGLLKGKNKKDE